MGSMLGSLQRSIAVSLLVASALLAGGCPGESAEQIMKTAEFEVLQRNTDHARQLYQRIIDEYPGSAEAKTAAERLATLEP
jgi:hypothetical protein